MKALLLGWENVDYAKKGTNERVQGLTLYVAGENPKVTGLASEDKWVNRTSNPKLFDKITSWAMAEPVSVEIVEETVIGNRYPMLVDVILLGDEAAEQAKVK